MAESLKAEHVEEAIAEPRLPPVGAARALPTSTGFDAERLVGRILRMGALGSGVLFASSLVVEMLSAAESSAVAADFLRKAAGSVLLVTPIARLVVGGTLLGVRGEWRYALYAGGILFLLAVALGTGGHV